MIISSHQLVELEELCSRFLFIESGKLADGAGQAESFLDIELRAPVTSISLETLADQQIGQLIEADGHRMSIPQTIDTEALNQIVAELGAKNLIQAITSRKSGLETLFTGAEK